MAEEIGLLRQAVATKANLQAVYNAYRVNQELEVAANNVATLARIAQLPLHSQRTLSLMMEPL